MSVSFGDIRDELVNNRVDSEDRRERIEERIELPLAKIASERYPELDKVLERLEKEFKDPNSSAVADEAIAHANETLTQLNQVLEAMVDIESFNELMELVRKMIDEQEELLKKTNEKRDKSFFDL